MESIELMQTTQSFVDTGVIATDIDDAHASGEVAALGDKRGRKKSMPVDEIGTVPLTFHLDMLSNTMALLRVNRETPPPLIPLCRILSHRAIRTIGKQRLRMKRLFKEDGYLMEKGDFILSMATPTGQSVLVKDHVKALWDPIWEQLSSEFDEAISHDTCWSDMQGRMFICWDGNHRVVGWMEAIHEDFSCDMSRHVLVRASFIEPDVQSGMALLSSMNRINRFV